MGTIYDKTDEELVDIANKFSASMTLAHDIFGKELLERKVYRDYKRMTNT